jgi:hypothetical protein
MAKFDISKFSTLDKVLGGAAALAVISLFLPWYSVSYHGVTYDSTSGFGTSWGWLGGLLIIAAGVYLVLQRSGVDLSKMPAPPSVIILGAAALGTLVMILRAITLPSYFGVTAGPAAGMYIAIICGVAEVVCAVLTFRSSGDKLPWAAKPTDPPATPPSSS